MRRIGEPFAIVHCFPFGQRLAVGVAVKRTVGRTVRRTVQPAEHRALGQPAYEPAGVPESAKASAITTIVETDARLVAVGFDGGFGSLRWTSDDGGQT